MHAVGSDSVCERPASRRYPHPGDRFAPRSSTGSTLTLRRYRGEGPPNGGRANAANPVELIVIILVVVGSGVAVGNVLGLGTTSTLADLLISPRRT